MVVDYSNPQALLESVRKQRREDDDRRRRSQGTGGDANAYRSFDRTITIGGGTDETSSDDDNISHGARRETPPSSYGGDGSPEGGSGSDDSTDYFSRLGGGVTTERGGGVDQRDGYDYEQYGPPQHRGVVGTVKSKFSAFNRVYQKHYPRQPQQKTKVKKEAAQGKIGGRLSDAETVKLKPRLVKVLLWQTLHADQFIQATTRGHKEVYIWSIMSEYEVSIWADFLINRGRESIVAADTVRKLASLAENIQAIGMFSIKMYYTIKTYLERGIGLR